MTVDIDRLIEVQAAIRTDTQSVYKMVGVFGAKATQDNAFLVGSPITVRVLEVK